MAKKSFEIKTSKFFTKTCSNCGKEYPSWFVSCPYCKTPWDKKKYEQEQQKEGKIKKDVKIMVKITEENFEEPIKKVNLKFSPNQGQAWYQLLMEEKSDNIYEAQVLEVPDETTLIYFIEVELENNEIVVENNNGEYYHYKVSPSEPDS
ncbi:MAG: hypothetical protein BAJALOKI1v1_1430008 [Promethearchaeota archaeon]|nr:MAG: hypothetical protein BAJALOKI1v1_1430008 [Candidatus Lokiarchaeota archaeon]